MSATCNNCGNPKPNRYYKACPECRAKWRKYDRKKRKTSNELTGIATELLEVLEKVLLAHRHKDAVIGEAILSQNLERDIEIIIDKARG